MKKLIRLLAVCATAALLGSPAAAAAPRAHTASVGVSGLDEEYLTTSMQGDLFEIRGGRLALRRSHNPAVLRLARRLIADHSKSFKDAVEIAHRHGVEIPKAPTMSQQWELRVVAGFSGRKFDREYSRLEAYDHVQDLSESWDEVDHGFNAAVRNDARQEIPTLRQHLALARAALRAS